MKAPPTEDAGTADVDGVGETDAVVVSMDGSTDRCGMLAGSEVSGEEREEATFSVVLAFSTLG